MRANICRRVQPVLWPVSDREQSSGNLSHICCHSPFPQSQWYKNPPLSLSRPLHTVTACGAGATVKMMNRVFRYRMSVPTVH